ncbi:putative E3 ubiquitin protein ligase [Neolecta irregularis DAH-3]|uniref:HECT-type E3 ubiquitin transferase n=1 Tax=Neolecta irregularis (strain DAH-3) TaxID=1198029 RepID=A0A1U7LRM8_NEOID|nr:putative E3 ubiquitin protein ligase [Neolecta irregularis DAH-3]|eukprot:OLL25278.1 putative E3 ubiquitin protein ligase [Neolecta irregularis DAH-3]
MQLFDGSHKQRRSINLGGSNARSATRDVALSKAQADRRAREQERQRQKAACSIQAFWRGRSEARIVRDRLRNRGNTYDWDYRLRRFALIFDSKLDFEELLAVLQYINSIDRNELLRMISVNTFSFYKIVTIVLKVIRNRQFEKISAAQTLRIDTENEQLLGLIVAVFGFIPHTWFHHIYESLQAFTQSFLNTSIDNKLLLKTFDSLQLAVTKPLQLRPHLSSSCLLFIYFRLNTETINLDLWTPLVDQIRIALPLKDISLFRSRLQDRELSCQDASNVFVNFMRLYPLQNIMNSQSPSSIITDWLTIVALLFLKISVVPVSHEEEDDEISLHTQEHDPYQGTILHETLLNLLSTKNLEFILTQASQTLALELATFIISLLQLLPSRRSHILMQIAIMASDSDIIKSFWKVAKQTTVYHSITTNLKISTGGGWVEIMFLMEIYSRILITMVDDEFFDSSRNPLTLDEIKEITDFLKPLSFIFWYTEANSTEGRVLGGSAVTFGQARMLTTRLIQQIHAREYVPQSPSFLSQTSSRRRFLPPDHWLLIGHDLRGFLDAVILEYRRTALEQTDEMATEYKTEIITPRLNILRNIPFLVPFDTRIEVLQTFISLDKERLHITAFQFDARQGATVRRNHLFEDAFDQLNSIGSGLKSRLSIEFIDEHGIKEMGIDGGGLTKEFITSVCKQAFHTDYGLFVETKDNLLYPNHSSLSSEPQNLAYYEFLGRVIGKAIYEGILVDAAFAPFFLLKWLGKLSYLDDLSSLDDRLYHGLIQLKQYIGDVETDFALNFTINDEEFGKSSTIELIPNGSNISVTNNNRLQYIHLVSNYRLNTQLARQSAAFVRGLSDLIDTPWLAMFNQQELQTLVGGATGAIDLVDLRNNTKYYDFADTDQFIAWFWSILAELQQPDLRKFLKFVTSVERPPLLGFKELNPPFSIRFGGSDLRRLPSASTCINLLKIPRYKTKSDLKNKIMMAIQHGEGFGLS